jgi:hypothetical protein
MSQTSDVSSSHAAARAAVVCPSRFADDFSTMSETPSTGRRAKVRATLYVSSELLNEARNAAVFLAGYPVRLTLTKLAEDALREQLDRLKERYNGGEDFPPRDDDLRGGRPIAA